MTWQTEMGRLLRYLINDLDTENPTYDDDRIEETIVVAAQLLQSNIDYYYQIYTVDIESATINPDPMVPYKEDGFVNLVCMQAALLILWGEFKNSTLSAVIINDGPSKIDYTMVTANKKMLYEDMKKTFNQAVYQYRAGNSIAGHAIIHRFQYHYFDVPGHFNTQFPFIGVY